MCIYPEAILKEKNEKGSLYIRNEERKAYPINKWSHKKGIYETWALYILAAKLKRLVTLEKPLKAGEYKVTADVEIFEPQNKKKKGTTPVEIRIIVK